MKNIIVYPFAILIACFCLFGGCTSTTNQVDIQVNRMPGVLPQLIFACDLSTDSAEILLSRPEVINDLKLLHYGIALSIPEYDSGRAKIVQHLNQEDIPVTAWLVMPSKLGYYFNASNASEAPGRFADFETWTATYKLRWASVGLDIEPGLTDFVVLQKGGKLKLLVKVIGRSLSLERKHQAQAARQTYDSLIQWMKKDGYSPQTYQLLFMADERKAQSMILDRIFGIVPAKGGLEALMVYSSFNHVGPALVYSYGKEAAAISIGSTSGGDDSSLNNQFRPLNWQEFSNDLICASHFTHTIGVYSLQGCLQQDFLSRLKSFDWNQTVLIPAKSIDKVAHFRKVVGILIWVLSYWIYMVIIVILLIVLFFWIWRARRIKRKKMKG